MTLTPKTKAVILLLLFTVIVYSNSLAGKFICDDEYFIVKNTHIKNLINIPSFFVNPSAVAFAELAQDVYRPVTTISYALDYRFWALDVLGYHLANVVFHSFNAILLFAILMLAFGDIFVAFLASLLFACHPVQTEVVAWISGRSSVLFLFFYLASFLYYIRFLREPRKRYLIFSLALYAVSLFSKEMAVSLPLLLVAYDIHFFNKDALRRKLARYAPYFILAAFFVLTRFFVLGRVNQCGWWGGSPYRTFLTMTPVIGEYLKLLLFPLKLCAFYVTTVCNSVTQAKVLVPLGSLAVLIAAMPFIFKRWRMISFSICLFFITLLPVSNIVPLRALMAERFLYLPSIGFCLLIAVLLEKLSRVRVRPFFIGAKSSAILIAVLLVLAYSARTMMRNDDWRDPAAITASTLKLDPLNPWALTLLGVAYSGEERYEDAIKPLAKAMALTDNYFSPKNILGFCYIQLGRYDDAVRVLTKALALKPCNLEALNSLGVAYANLKRYDEAIKQFKAAISVDKSFIDAYMNLATAYDHMGRYNLALEEYGKVEANTNSAYQIAVSYLRIGDVYIKLKNPQKAREYYEKAVRLCGRGMDELKKVAIQRLNAKWDVK